MSVDDGSSDTEGRPDSKATSVSQVVVIVPPETNALCLSLLEILKNRGMVLSWHWEEDTIRVWVDTDLMLSRTSVPEGIENSWLVRLIEAAQYFDHFPCQNADDLATDFSYLGCDLPQTLLQLA